MKRIFHCLTGMLIVTVLLTLGCGSESAPKVPAIPSTPDGTVQTVVTSLGNHQPGVVWAALPASYQKDVNDLIQEFTAKVDHDMYNKSFEVLGKLSNVMASKKQYILNSSFMATVPFDREEVSRQWDSIVAMLDTVIKSDLRSVDSLRKMDVGRFLSTTGARVMAQSVALAEALGEDEEIKQLHELKDARVELISSDGPNAVVRMSLPNGFTEDIELTQVEGKWLPADIAAEWKDEIAEAKAELANLSTPEYKMPYMAGLSAIDTILTSLQNTKSQEEFDQAISGAMGMLMGF